MLQVYVKQLLQDKNITHPMKWLQALGVGRRRARQIMRGHHGDISLDDLTVLCLALKCTPNDLLYWEQGKLLMPEGHPLQALVRQKSAISITSRLRRLSVAQMDELKNMLDQMEGKKPAGG